MTFRVERKEKAMNNVRLIRSLGLAAALASPVFAHAAEF